MTGISFFAILVFFVAGVLAFDWARTQRMKKALAAGGPAPHQHTGRQASEGVNSETLARQQANATNNTGYGGGI